MMTRPEDNEFARATTMTSRSQLENTGMVNMCWCMYVGDYLTMSIAVCHEGIVE